jgi:hypothetical protein
VRVPWASQILLLDRLRRAETKACLPNGIVCAHGRWTAVDAFGGEPAIPHVDLFVIVSDLGFQRSALCVKLLSKGRRLSPQRLILEAERSVLRPQRFDRRMMAPSEAGRQEILFGTQ